jgi:hypothetical protein
MPARTDLDRELRNLAGAHPLARLKALHGIGLILRQELDSTFDTAELAQVRAARSARASWRDPFGRSGRLPPRPKGH